MPLVILLVLAFLGFVFFGALCGFVAQARTRQLKSELDDVRRQFRRFRAEAAPLPKLRRNPQSLSRQVLPRPLSRSRSVSRRPPTQKQQFLTPLPSRSR